MNSSSISGEPQKGEFPPPFLNRYEQYQGVNRDRAGKGRGKEEVRILWVIGFLLGNYFQPLYFQVFFHLPDPEGSEMKHRSGQQNLGSSLDDPFVKVIQFSRPS